MPIVAPSGKRVDTLATMLRGLTVRAQARLRSAVLARTPNELVVSNDDGSASGAERSYDEFHSDYYSRQNQRVQEHLATLGLDLDHRTVFEVGAGIGDHTSFFLDRGCQVTTSDGRPENYDILRRRHPGCQVWHLDLDDPVGAEGYFQVVYCYGTLYHLSKPAEALAFLADRCDGQLLLETCVSYGDEPQLNAVAEDAENPSQALHGTGCRPTRSWVVRELGRHFDHVYLTTTQPWHENFPLDWSPEAEPRAHRRTRCVFVASRQPLDLPTLTTEIPLSQQRP